MLQLGSLSPDFNLPDADMGMFRLSKLRGKNVILYFYPKDDTPGCIVEAIEFSDLEDEFNKCDTIVIGISRDDCISHAGFRDKHGLSVILLADVDGRVCEKYGVWQEKEKDGVRRMCILRSTFLIGRDGTLLKAFYGVNAKGHAAELLNIIRGMA